MSHESSRPSAVLIEALRGVLRQVAEPVAVLKAILDQAVNLTGASRGLLVEVGAEGGLAYRVLHGFDARQLDGDAGGFSRRVFERVLADGRAVLFADVLDDPHFGNLESVRALRARSILCAPIPAGGRIAALVHLESSKVGHFDAGHLKLLNSLIEVAAPVLEALQAGRDVIRDRDELRLSESRFRGEAEESRRVLAAEWSFGRFVGASPAVRELEETVRKAAGTDYPVLILGETGTGKSILARVLHYGGPRSGGPLVTVFCPTLERGMVEAELFGHRRGAFTGAVTDRLGKVQAADRGTLFLDEIGELPPEIQPKLLRLLQERTYERVGDAEERRSDVRVIAATNRDLEAEVQAGRFRRDLYERLCFLPIRIPPLRERTSDIRLLLRHCLDLTDSGRWVELSDEATAWLEQLDFSWPGNVRHVEQLAARLTTEGLRGQVSVHEVMRLLGATPAESSGAREGAGTISAAGHSPEPGGLEAGLPRLLEEAERRWLTEALRRFPRLTRAELAARLKISESALYKKLRQYQIAES